MIFIDNKYTTIYYSIINNAHQQNRKKLKRSHSNYIYYEKHHIIPKSLNGSNLKDNLVLLIAREHFICHWLLIKMTDGQAKHKMIYALNGMRRDSSNQLRYNTKITARVYASLRGKLVVSDTTRAKMKGRVVSDETRAKLSVIHKGKTISSETRAKLSVVNQGKIVSETTREKLRGRTHSDETKAKMSAAHKGRTHSDETKANMRQRTHSDETKANMRQRTHSDETKAKIGNAHRGKVISIEQREKLRIANTGRILSYTVDAETRNNARKRFNIIIQCPYCNKEGGNVVMKRWHFDNCKLKEIQ